MKYRLGEKVTINKGSDRAKGCHNTLEKLDPPYVTTIYHVRVDNITSRSLYLLKEINFWWDEHEIDGLYIKNKPIPERIDSRFEILDL